MWRPGPSYWRRLDPEQWFPIMMEIFGMIGLVMTVYFSFQFYHAYKYGVKKESKTKVSLSLPAKEAYQLLFLSEDVSRKHVYVTSTQGEAVFWLEPKVQLSKAHNLSQQQVLEMRLFVEANLEKIEKAWLKYKSK